MKKRKKMKLEKRSAESPILKTSEFDEKAFSLIFGKASVDNYARNLSAVHRASTLIADSIAALPLTIYKTDRGGNKQKFTKHPAYNLLYIKPNPFVSSHDWIRKMVNDLIFAGNAYSLIHRNPLGEIIEIEYINPNSVSIVRNYSKDGKLVEVLYSISGRGNRCFTSDEMIHIKGVGLSDDCTEGISVLKYAAKSLGLLQSQEKNVQDTFDNQGLVRGVISINGAITNKVRQDVQQAFRESVHNNGGLVVMSNAQSFTPISSSSEEMELLSSRKYGIAEIARWFGVSPILLFHLENSTYSSAQEARTSLLTDSLQPYLYRIEAELENKLLTPSELKTSEIKFDTQQWLRVDESKKLELARSLFNLGALNIDEIRAMFDLDALPNGLGQQYYLQAQLVTVPNSFNLGSTVEESNNTLDNNQKPQNEGNEEVEDVAEENLAENEK